MTSHVMLGSDGCCGEALVEERSTLAFATKPVVGRTPQSRHQPTVLRVSLGQGSFCRDPDVSVSHGFLKNGRALPIFEVFGGYIFESGLETLVECGFYFGD